MVTIIILAQSEPVEQDQTGLDSLSLKFSTCRKPAPAAGSFYTGSHGAHQGRPEGQQTVF